ncbi:MAG: type I-E CRISPR-associated protein Cse2/CasB [Limnochordia bacterium]
MNLQPEPQSLMSVVVKISSVLGNESFAAGDRAALRRMQPGHPPPLAFYRFAMRYLPESWETKLDDWVAVTAGMALMSPQAHDPTRGMGKVLAEAGYSEARLERLLASEGEVRRLLLLRAARFLAAKGFSMNWVDGAVFLLTDDGNKREALHRRIAKEFYDTQYQIERRQGVS